MVMQLFAAPGHHQHNMNMYQKYEYVCICIIRAFPLKILHNMIFIN